MSTRRAVFAAVALVVVAVALLGVFAGGNDEAAAANVTMDSNQVLRTSEVGFGLVTSYEAPTSRGFGLAHDGTNLWYFAKTGFASSALFKLDPADGSVLDSFPAPGPSIGLGLAHDGTFLYVTNSNFATQPETIFVIDPSDGSIVTSYADPGSPSGSTTGLAFLAGSLYAIDDVTEIISELDPADGTVLNSFSVAATGVIRGLASNGSNLVTYENLTDEYLIVSPVDGSIIDSFFLPAQGPSFAQVTGLAFDGGTLYSLEIASGFTPAVIAVFSDQAPKLATRTPTFTPTPTPTGPFGLTGKWNIDFVGIVSQTFSAQVTESGTALVIDLGVGDAQLFGTIDPVTGDFDVSGCPGDCGGLSMSGSVSPDGKSMSGTFSSGLIGSGTFAGNRKGTPTPVATSTPPPPVGGIAIDSDLKTLSLQATNRSGSDAPRNVAIAAALVVGLLAVGGTAWYRKRSS